MLRKVIKYVIIFIVLLSIFFLLTGCRNNEEYKDTNNEDEEIAMISKNTDDLLNTWIHLYHYINSRPAIASEITFEEDNNIVISIGEYATSGVSYRSGTYVIVDNIIMINLTKYYELDGGWSYEREIQESYSFEWEIENNRLILIPMNGAEEILTIGTIVKENDDPIIWLPYVDNMSYDEAEVFFETTD